MTPETHSKVQARHLKRNAYLYVRQSTLQQVFENTESTKRQYALRERALALGWKLDQVVVIDSDLGQSGASAVDRLGFQRLVTEVGLGRAGIVMGLEVSRLARNSTDWHRLLEICALADSLILDEDGIYDPAHPGLGPKDMDLAMLYDCFSIVPIIELEELGLAEHGAGGAFFAEGKAALGGQLPVNTHGGMLSHAHAGAVGGLMGMIEAVRQLRGEGASRQVKDPSSAIVHGEGGIMSSHCTAILTAEPR